MNSRFSGSFGALSSVGRAAAFLMLGCGSLMAIPQQSSGTQNGVAFAISGSDLFQTGGATVNGTGNFAQEGVLGLSALNDGIYGAQGGQNSNPPGLNAFSAGTGESVTISFAQPTGITLNSLNAIAAWDSARASQSYQLEYQSTVLPGVWHRLASVTHNPGQLGGQIVNTSTTVTDSTGVLAANVSAIRLNFANTDFWGWNGYREIDAAGSVSAAAVGPQFLKSIQINELYGVSGSDLLQGGGITTTSVGDFTDEGLQGLASLTDGGYGPAGGQGSNPPGMAAAGANNGESVTYGLNLAGAPQGYTITGVDIYAGWDGFRGGQNYSLQYSTVAAPGTFISLGSVDWDATANNAPGGNINTRVMVRDLDGVLATNVASVRLAFGDVSFGFAGYREVDVFGTPTPVPEPALAGLIAAGGGMLLRRRRPCDLP